ncbi:MAG: hypothetical protein EOO32_05215 [Comamonadaceae bacterium]|nr:MAG: hypothetical protein EOO32_05215 [Comamonadaceae bacterium]
MTFASHTDASADWHPVSQTAALAVTALSAWIVWVHFFTEDAWVMLLDHANLALHEAGHPLVAIVSGHLSVYGGTLFQLLFPALFLRHFRQRGNSTGWAVALVWLGENLMNVSRYMKDARAQQLPLVGGGDHDWTEIFSRWGVLASDVRIGNGVRLLGLCLVLYAVRRLWRWRRLSRADDVAG